MPFFSRICPGKMYRFHRRRRPRGQLHRGRHMSRERIHWKEKKNYSRNLHLSACARLSLNRLTAFHLSGSVIMLSNTSLPFYLKYKFLRRFPLQRAGYLLVLFIKQNLTNMQAIHITYYFNQSIVHVIPLIIINDCIYLHATYPRYPLF